MTAASTLSLPFSRGALQLRQQYPVAFQPVGLDPALLHCGPDPAARLADVAAITVAALADEGPHLGKAAGQLPRLDAPESHLAESRRTRALISPIRSLSPGCTALSRLDFPAPDGPVTTEMRPFKASAN